MDGAEVNSVERYFTNIGKGFWTVMVGMKVTMKHLFTPAVTIQYPDARMAIPERGRNRLYVNMDDCIGCNQCGMACPADCIKIETAKSLPTEDLGTTSTGQKKRLWVTKFDIDFAKCCYCGLCVPPCPTECIYMTDVYEFSEYDRNNLIYSFTTLTPEEAAAKALQAKEAEKEAAAKKAAAAAAVAAQKAAQAAKAAAAPAPTGSQGLQHGVPPVVTTTATGQVTSPASAGPGNASPPTGNGESTAPASRPATQLEKPAGLAENKDDTKDTAN